MEDESQNNFHQFEKYLGNFMLSFHASLDHQLTSPYNLWSFSHVYIGYSFLEVNTFSSYQSYVLLMCTNIHYV
jgi:hypothetical protein